MRRLISLSYLLISIQVLDELDIMLKVWKKRTEHVFTAHIQKGDEDRAAEDASGDDSSMRYVL